MFIVQCPCGYQDVADGFTVGVCPICNSVVKSQHVEVIFTANTFDTVEVSEAVDGNAPKTW